MSITVEVPIIKISVEEDQQVLNNFDVSNRHVSTPLSSKACAFSISSIMAGVNRRQEECKNEEEKKDLMTSSSYPSTEIPSINSQHFPTLTNSLQAFESVPNTSCPNNKNDEKRIGESSSSSSPASSSLPPPLMDTPNTSSSLQNISCRLEPKDLWDRFHKLGTEMIITKSGRRMFPTIRLAFCGDLHPDTLYDVAMEVTAVDRKRYRYVYHRSSWVVAGRADPPKHSRLYFHPESPFTGHQLIKQNVSFEKLKLTNNMNDNTGQIMLNSMHRYQPKVYIFFHQPPTQQHQQQPEIHSTTPTFHPTSPTFSPVLRRHGRLAGTQRERPTPTSRPHKCFTFPETTFTAVTAYQNQLITKLKIDSNPFAKGFRDSMRLVDIDRCRENLQPDLNNLSNNNNNNNHNKIFKPQPLHSTTTTTTIYSNDGKDLNRQLQKHFQDFVLNQSAARMLGKRKLGEDIFVDNNIHSGVQLMNNVMSSKYPLTIHPSFQQQQQQQQSIYSNHNIPRHLSTNDLRITDSSSSSPLIHPSFIYALCTRLSRSQVLPSFKSSIHPHPTNVSSPYNLTRYYNHTNNDAVGNDDDESSAMDSNSDSSMAEKIVIKTETF